MKSEAQQFRIPNTQQGENQRKRTQRRTRRERASEQEEKNECERWLEMALLCIETVLLCFFFFLHVLSAK